MEKILHIIKADYLSGYKLFLVFDNGENRIFDFSQVYDKGIFQRLKSMDYFRNFTLDGYTVDWNNEIGFTPEFLLSNGVSA